MSRDMSPFYRENIEAPDAPVRERQKLIDEADREPTLDKMRLTMTPELHEKIMDDCRSDAAKVIAYLEEEKRKGRAKNIFLFVLTVLTFLCTVFGVVNAIFHFF